MSISPTHKFFWQISEERITPKYNYLNRPRRQDFKESEISYIENGSLYIFSYQHFLKNKNRLGGKIGYIMLSEEYGLEIDSELDFKILETISGTLQRDKFFSKNGSC